MMKSKKALIRKNYNLKAKKSQTSWVLINLKLLLLNTKLPSLIIITYIQVLIVLQITTTAIVNKIEELWMKN